MCGIAGVITPKPLPAEQAVRRMNEAQRHRGPDGEGTLTIPLAHAHLALGHRRLSIIDLSSAGRQPMRNPDTDDWVVYNGELFNFLELRRELQADGARFRTNTDTEVVLKAYAAWGVKCFSRFHGMFALGIYDHKERQLVLARDHLGIKPLYFARCRDSFAFASELRALCATGWFGNDIDRRGLASLLAYGAVPEPLTIVKDVRMLEAGNYAILDLSHPKPWSGRLRMGRHWDFPIQQNTFDQEAVREQLRLRLSDSVRSHLISDVPVGVFLSSGVDSNAIAALAREHRGPDVDAFTISLRDHPDVNEGQIAASAARKLGIRFHEIELSESHVCQQAREFLEGVDQPTVDGLNTYIISQAVRRRGIKVALSGLGGDEVFGGYNTFREVPRFLRMYRAAGWIPQCLRRALAAGVYRRRPSSRRFKAMELASKPYDLRGFCLRRRRIFSDTELAAFGFLSNRLDLDEDFLPFESAPHRRLAGWDAEGAVSILESRFYMGNMLLRDSDVFGMRHGLEIRVPLLDRRVVDLAYSLPGHARVKRSSVNKPLLVEALGARLHAELPRLKKRGFHVPIAAWMRGPLRDLATESLLTARRSGLIDPTALDSLWQSFFQHPNDPDWSRVWLICVIGQYLASQHRRLFWKAAA